MKNKRREGTTLLCSSRSDREHGRGGGGEGCDLVGESGEARKGSGGALYGT